MAEVSVNVTFGTALRHVQAVNRLAVELIELIPPWQRYDADRLMNQLETLTEQLKNNLQISQEQRK